MTWQPKGLAESLKHRRQVLRLTQEEAAQRIGIHPSNYNEWECQVHEPHIRLWPAVIAFLSRDPICERPRTIPEKIAAIRRRYGFSYGRLGRQLGTTDQVVLRWAQGRTKPDKSRSAGLDALLASLPLAS